jgi:hypothetical protein
MITPCYKTACTYLNELSYICEKINLNDVLSFDFPSFLINSNKEEDGKYILKREGDIAKNITILGHGIDKCELYISGALSTTFINNNLDKTCLKLKLNLMFVRVQYNCIQLKIIASKVENVYIEYSVLPGILRKKICQSDMILQDKKNHDFQGDLIYRDGSCYFNEPTIQGETYLRI